MKTIEVSEETYERIKSQLKEDEVVEVNNYADLIGGKWFFRTFTYHLVGKVVKQVGDFLQLENASWIADSGRFMNFLQSGSVKEVEPVGTAFVNIKTVTDFFPWKHDLPKEQK